MSALAAVAIGACVVFGEVQPYVSQIPQDAYVAYIAPTVEVLTYRGSDILPLVFEQIVECESGGDPTAQNPVSSASGLYQFIVGTWLWVWADLIGEPPPQPEAYLATVTDQTRAAEALYSTMGLSPWEASRQCWGEHG